MNRAGEGKSFVFSTNENATIPQTFPAQLLMFSRSHGLNMFNASTFEGLLLHAVSQTERAELPPGHTSSPCGLDLPRPSNGRGKR